MAARRAQPKSKAIAPKSSAEIRKELARRRAAQDPVVGAGTGNFISTKGKRLTYRGAELDSPLPVIILAWAQDFAYFDSPYREEEFKPPACAALARTNVRELKPLPDVPVQQAESCFDCPMNEWESNPLGGRGKACSNRYRVALLPASDPTHDIAMIRVSSSGYAGFETFINRVNSKSEDDVCAWVHLLEFMDGDFPVVKFTEQALIDNDELLSAVFNRMEEAEALVETSTYDFTGYEPPRAARGSSKKKATARRR